MKKAAIVVMASAIVSTSIHAEIIGSWDFNSSPPDDTTRTGTLSPAIGAGTAELVGGTAGTFAAGSATDPGADNSGWNTASYPAQGADNKSAGVRFAVSTVGYRDIAVSFELRVTGTASRYARLQYTVNGTDYSDLALVDVSTANVFVPQTHSLAALANVNGNPNFGFRIVTEFEKSATGQGADGYVTASGSSYSPSGTIRFDLVRVTGESDGTGNTPPVISVIPDQITRDGLAVVGVGFAVNDAETTPEALVLTGSSSNPQLLPPANLVFGGSGRERTISLTPASGQTGTTEVTVTVSDGRGSAQRTFRLTVLELIRLAIHTDGSQVVISWPADVAGYRLESCASLSSPAWEVVPNEPVLAGDQRVVRLIAVQGKRFYRMAARLQPGP